MPLRYQARAYRLFWATIPLYFSKKNNSFINPGENHMNLLRKSRFKLSTLALSVATAISVGDIAHAQEPVEEIEVTGTRIRNTDGMVMPTPVTAVTTEEMRDFDPSSSVS